MEENKSIIEDDDGELTTNQIKLKAQVRFIYISNVFYIFVYLC